MPCCIGHHEAVSTIPIAYRIRRNVATWGANAIATTVTRPLPLDGLGRGNCYATFTECWQAQLRQLIHTGLTHIAVVQGSMEIYGLDWRAGISAFGLSTCPCPCTTGPPFARHNRALGSIDLSSIPEDPLNILNTPCYRIVFAT